MMAPGILLGTFEQLHLKFTNLAEVPGRKFRFYLLDRHRTRSEPNNLLNENTNKLVDLNEVFRFGSSCHPKSEERLYSGCV